MSKIQSFDQSGKMTINKMGLINNSKSTQIISDYKNTIDWTSPNTLSDDVYTTSIKNKAISQIYQESLPNQIGIVKNQVLKFRRNFFILFFNNCT